MNKDNDFVKKFDYWDTAYNSLILNVHDHGVWTDNNVRTKYADGTPATYKAIAGVCFKLDNSKDRAFLLTTKNVLWKSAIKELYWIYIMQSNNVTELEKMNCGIWTAWKKPDDTIGPSYGAAVNIPTFGYKNQLEYVVETLKKDPNSRRAMINLWIPEDLHKMALTPCCYNLIFNILDGKLHMQLNIRSSDIALGLPFNIFQFQVLHKLIAHEVGVEPADFIVMISNLHYYDRHEEKLLEQIDMPVYGDAKLRIEYPDSIWDFKPEMVHVDEYKHGPKIDFEIAI
jgi:thymidylate synthase|nr:MAG TPA: Thymidylate synthase [Caudoviricetes sp.]